MIRDSISKIFDFIPETNLIEEDFYYRRGQYPVFSGQTEAEGILACIDSYNQEEPCITFTTYGMNAGKIFYREGKFTIGRNCMGLRPKKEYEDKMNLRWFSYRYQNLFHRLRIGDMKGQRSLNKTLLENVEVVIPSTEVQEKQLDAYEKAQSILSETEELLEKSKSLLRSSIKMIDHVYQEKISVLFHMKGGNSGLTEEFTYYNLPNNKEESIPILSGATIKANRLGDISRDAKPNDKKLKIFSGPAILVVRKGNAGQMSFIERGEFATNDDAYVIIPKEKWKDKINLRWFAHQYQELFFNLVTSKSDNATLNKGYIKNQKVKLPDIDSQNTIGEKLLIIDKSIERLGSSMEHIEDLIEYEID